MARYFREEDIDEFRECFYLFARNGHIRTLDELTIIMRSLGLSPTIAELNKYLKDKGGKMSFADFLEAMHLQTRAEDLPKEVIEAFQAADTAHTGTIPARQLAHMLLHKILMRVFFVPKLNKSFEKPMYPSTVMSNMKIL